MLEDAKRRRSQDRARRLEEFIDGLGVNRREFAAQIGVNPSYVSNLLTGRKPLGENALARICEAFQIPAAWFDESDQALPAIPAAPVPADVLKLAQRIAALDRLSRATVEAVVATAERMKPRRPHKTGKRPRQYR